MKKQKNPVSLPKKNYARFPTYALILNSWPCLIKLSELGHGSWAQMRRCRKYARAKGYVISRQRGYNSREAILNCIQNIPGRKFVVIVDSLSRLGRNKNSIDAFCDEVRSLGVSIESLGYDLGLPAKEQFQKRLTANHTPLKHKTNGKK